MGQEKVLSRYAVAAMVLAAVVATSILLGSRDAKSADARRGRLLYENHCTVCHTSIVHLREQRRATSREEIRVWISRWQKELGLTWGSVEVDDVSEYLNDRFYRFDKDT